jgi:hypothetical protein
MLSATVKYDARERKQYLSVIHTRAAYIKAILIGLGILLLALAPLLGWFVWHRQWLALAALGCWVLYTWRTLFVRRQRALDDSLREQGPHTYTLLPAGLLVTSKQNNYTYCVWSQFEKPVKDASGLMLTFADENLRFFIPSASFAREAEFDAFAKQTLKFHSAANPALANVLPNFREPESQPRYVLRYQLPGDVIKVSDASEELREKFPYTIPEQQEMPKWKAYLIGLLMLGTIILFINPTADGVHSNYTHGTLLVFVFYFGYLWLLFKAFLWLQPRWTTKTSSRLLPEIVLSLSESGLHCAQLGQENARSWSDLDAVVHCGGKLTLWRRGILQDIIPESAFASPAEAATCAEWILSKLAPPQAQHADAQHPDPQPDYPPDTENPYQAPRYS